MQAIDRAKQVTMPELNAIIGVSVPLCCLLLTFFMNTSIICLVNQARYIMYYIFTFGDATFSRH